MDLTFIRRTVVTLTFITSLLLGLSIGRNLDAPASAQTAVWYGVTRNFAAQTTTGQTASFDTRVAGLHTAQLVVTGGPAACTYRLQGSNDNTSWFDISASDITCTSTTVSHTADKPARYIRGSLLTFSGGTSPTVTLHYTGK